MGVTDWFRKLAGRPTVDAGAEPEDTTFMPGESGVSAFGGLEDAAAVEAVERQFEAPEDLAP